jgi:hypothetical protein
VIAFFTARDDATTSGGDAIPAEAPGLVADPPAEIAELVRLGNIVVDGPAGDRKALEEVAREIAGDPFSTPQLERAGQAIKIRTGSDPRRIVAWSAQRRYVTFDPEDRGLLQFIDYWLGAA